MRGARKKALAAGNFATAPALTEGGGLLGLDGVGKGLRLVGPVALLEAETRLLVLGLEFADVPEVLERKLVLTQCEVARSAAVVRLGIGRVELQCQVRVGDRQAVRLDKDQDPKVRAARSSVTFCWCGSGRELRPASKRKPALALLGPSLVRQWAVGR